MATIKGVWVFNKTMTGMTGASATKYYVNYTHKVYDGESFTLRESTGTYFVFYETGVVFFSNELELGDSGISTRYNATTDCWYCFESDIGTYYGPDDMHTLCDSLMIRTFDFGETEQTVNNTFYNWFIANAKPQTTMPILLNSPEGIRLNTKGKLCSSDIDVVLDLQVKYASVEKEDQIITAEAGKAGLAAVHVSAPWGIKTIKENGTYDVVTNHQVTVNVPIPDGYEIPTYFDAEKDIEVT